METFNVTQVSVTKFNLSKSGIAIYLVLAVMGRR